MADQTKPSKWFCRSTSTDKIAGPFDLVELAALLRAGDITGETLTQTEGDQEWAAFQSRREFESAKDMPADVIYRHLKDEAEERKSRWSLRSLYYLIILIFGIIGHGLFGGFRPTIQIPALQRFIVDELQRLFGH